MKPSNPEGHGYVADVKTSFIDEPKDYAAGETNSKTPSTKSNPDELLDFSRKRHTTILGPSQDDSTFIVFCGLRTVIARLLIWFNLPFCWFVGITIATRNIEKWLNAHFSGPESTVAIIFVATYIVYTILSHTIGVFGAIACELWWNPYARTPTLRGKVGREEEIAMVMQNRAIARRMFRCLLPCI